ncbi:MAG: hypothetical protein JWO24_3003 [Rhodospirillales bacterium]|nr:hypothetical protein [Rhodospirillales bacterium]
MNGFGVAKMVNDGASFGRRIATAMLGAAAAMPLTRSRASAGISPAAPFVVYYGQEDTPALGAFRLAVLDAEADDALLARRGPGAKLLGYASLGEVHRDRRYFAAAERDGLLLGPNPAWPEAAFVDLRSPRWTGLILDHVVPDILARGFDGIFLDTLDDAEHLEQQDPRRFAGMVDAAAALVRRIRRRTRGRPIMINRAYAVLPRVSGSFHMLLGESVRSKHVAEGGYTLTTCADYHWQRDQMLEARNRDRSLQVFSLDYWDPEDRSGIARLYAEQRQNGFVPYVATRDLTSIIPPPIPEVP